MSFFSSIRLNYQIKLIIFLKNVILFDVISDWVLFLSYLKIKDFIVVVLFKTRGRQEETSSLKEETSPYLSNLSRYF
jgi:hypothetical protein